MPTNNPNLVGVPEIRMKTINEFTIRSGTIMLEARRPGYVYMGDSGKSVLMLHTENGIPGIFLNEKTGCGDGWRNRYRVSSVFPARTRPCSTIWQNFAMRSCLTCKGGF